MKTKISPTVVGLFVLGALVLALISLYAFGNVHLFHKPQRFMVYFNESTHGLDIGSPVKLRGVRVGRVVSMTVRYNPNSVNQSVVAVGCELSRNIITSDNGSVLEVSDRQELQKLVNQGLSANLQILGIATGLLFVELDFRDPVAFPPPKPSPENEYIVVPSQPSAISELQASISEIVSNLRRIDFAALAGEIHGLLQDTRKQVNGLDLAALNDQWIKTGRSFEELATSPEIKQTITNLNSAVVQLNKTLQNLDTKVNPTSAELAKTLVEAQKSLKAFSEAAAEAKQFIAAQSGLGENANRTLAELADAAAQVQRLADFLERNPNALLTGRKPPH
ncbi:MAG TPA: MlaD family protein [Opitutaceae bacterium]